MPQLVVTDVRKQYGDIRTGCTALAGLSFSMEAGEFVAVRGPSGCGKSTLLHIVGAMDQPTSGRVLLHGQRLDGLSHQQLALVRRRRIGFVFQAFNLLPTLTAVENIALPKMLDGCHDRTTFEVAGHALDEVGLAAKADCYPSQLSGGELQRVAIARAVAIEPELLIADEPTGSLDSENGRRILDLLAHLNRTQRLTVLLATHSSEAASYASRVLYIRDGQLQGGSDAHERAASL